MNDSKSAIVPAQQSIGSFMEPLKETLSATEDGSTSENLQHADVIATGSIAGELQASGGVPKYGRPTRTAESFPFMELSSELRNMIYKDVLVAPCPIDIEVRNYYGRTSPTFPKRLHNETRPIYFNYNTFRCDSFQALRVFLSILKPEYRRCIRSLDFEFWGEAPAQAMKLLQGCVDLQYLQIDFAIWTLFDYRARKTRSLAFPGFNDLIKLRGIQRLQVNPPKGYLTGTVHWRAVMEDIDSIKNDLQVIKQPKSEAMIRRQQKREFPTEKAKRTVYGKANVMTRSEKAMANERQEEDKEHHEENIERQEKD
ncbi:MAG: hypothetical protein Q9221_003213 [Calogaya cf. arnoldii]